MTNTAKILWKNSHIKDVNRLLKKLLYLGSQQSHINYAIKNESVLQFSQKSSAQIVVGILFPSREPKESRRDK